LVSLDQLKLVAQRHSCCPRQNKTSSRDAQLIPPIILKMLVQRELFGTGQAREPGAERFVGRRNP
jgi:hypothetical protein